MRCMPQNTFVVKTDPETNMKYVAKSIDELTINHRADYKGMLAAMMPEQPDISICPFCSFDKYLSKLPRVCNSLWQRQLESFVENVDVWYCNSPVGRDMLTKLVKKKKLSALCVLCQIYAKSLHTCNIADARSITAHKTVFRLAIS